MPYTPTSAWKGDFSLNYNGYDFVCVCERERQIHKCVRQSPLDLADDWRSELIWCSGDDDDDLSEFVCSGSFGLVEEANVQTFKAFDGVVKSIYHDSWEPRQL